MNQGKILVIDNSTELLETLTPFLEEVGYKVKFILGYTSIFPHILDFEPNLIMLDVMLSGDYGRSLCSAIKYNKATMHIPIIIMSNNRLSLDNFRQCLADEALGKPFTNSNAIQKIRSVLQ